MTTQILVNDTQGIYLHYKNDKIGTGDKILLYIKIQDK